MNLNEMKITNTNNISISDALEAPLLKLNIKLDGTTVAPTTDDLIIYVAKNENDETDKKTYCIPLLSKLQYQNSQTDELLIEPVIKGTKVTLKTKVLRRSGSTTVVEEEYESTPIVLFEGSNYIYTNYVNAIIDVIYPQNNELVKYFLNNITYGENAKDKILSLDDIFFKDAFTEVDEKTNAEFNKLTIKCMNSTNNKFSLDCDGNLLVNTLTTAEGLHGGLTFSDVYPVGSYYETSNTNFDPNTSWGGTWVLDSQGKVTVAQDSSQTEFQTVGQTGGEKSHMLTAAEIPELEVQIPAQYGDSTWSRPYLAWASTDGTDYLMYPSGKTTGGDQPHNNLQPYIVVNRWHRTA